MCKSIDLKYQKINLKRSVPKKKRKWVQWKSKIFKKNLKIVCFESFRHTMSKKRCLYY